MVRSNRGSAFILFFPGETGQVVKLWQGCARCFRFLARTIPASGKTRKGCLRICTPQAAHKLEPHTKLMISRRSSAPLPLRQPARVEAPLRSSFDASSSTLISKKVSSGTPASSPSSGSISSETSAANSCHSLSFFLCVYSLVQASPDQFLLACAFHEALVGLKRVAWRLLWRLLLPLFLPETIQPFGPAVRRSRWPRLTHHKSRWG